MLNSKNFGVPQNRERVFIIGHTRGKPRPKVFPIGEGNYENSQSERRITSYAIDSNYGKGLYTPGKGNTRTMIYDVFNQQMRANQEVAGALKGEGIADTSLGTALILPDIANAVDVDGYLRFGERPRDENGKPQLLPIGYRRIRRLTPIECERLQGFPDGWTEKGIDIKGNEVSISDTQRYRALGNAVTTNVIEAVGVKLGELKKEIN